MNRKISLTAAALAVPLLIAPLFGDAQTTGVRPDQIKFRLGPGLASTPGTYNTGNQEAGIGSTVSPQVFWQGHATNYTVQPTDTAKLMEATAAGISFTLPAVGPAGSLGYAFSYGRFPYTLQAQTGTLFYGCGVESQTITVDFDVTVTSAGLSWKCTGARNTSNFVTSYGPGMNLAGTPVPVIRRNITAQIAAIDCVVGGVGPAGALIDLYSVPNNTAPANVTTCGAGCTKLTATNSCHADGAAGQTQANLGNSGPGVLIPAGNVVWMVGSGAGWGSGDLTGTSGMVELVTSP